MKIITKETWLKSEMATPLFLCQIPFSVSELEELKGLTFDEYQEDGLGTLYSCFVLIDNKEIWLRGFIDKGQKSEPVTVEMHSDEPSPKLLVKLILEYLSIDASDLVELGDYLNTPKYVLSRLDDNNNEVEISRFHDEQMAEHLRKNFEEKGHKQDYYVQKTT